MQHVVIVVQVPNAVFEFRLSVPGQACSRVRASVPQSHRQAQTENVHAEFTHAELFKFYEQLQCIQEQLDQLS